MTAADPPRLDPALTGFLGAEHARNERRTWIVAGVCVLALVAQLAGGLAFRSMALTASAIHMGAHVAAMATAALAYAAARRYARDRRFAWGSGKLGDLAGFANAVVLAITAVLIAAESIGRLIAPQPTAYTAALPLAVGGLVLTLVCVGLLRPKAGAAHDLNLSAAHLHLTGDAVMGGLAIAGLLAGQRLGWAWADPLAGLFGAGLVAQFALSLMRQAAKTLLDMTHEPLAAEIRVRLEAAGDRVEDLRLWRLGPGHHAAVVAIVADAPQPADAYHARLRGIAGLSHIAVEPRRAAGGA